MRIQSDENGLRSGTISGRMLPSGQFPLHELKSILHGTFRGTLETQVERCFDSRASIREVTQISDGVAGEIEEVLRLSRGIGPRMQSERRVDGLFIG